MLRRAGVKRLGFASTSAVYGISPLQPIPEDAFFPQPISLYGATKLGCEALIAAFRNLFALECWIFRFANIVGPKVRKKGRTVIGDFILRLQENPRKLKILGNGELKHDLKVEADKVSAAAREKIEKAGGTITLRDGRTRPETPEDVDLTATETTPKKRSTSKAAAKAKSQAKKKTSRKS